MVETKLRILVVEDDAAIRDHLANRLTSYELVFAVCQNEALEQLETQFDLVLLDLRLPITPGAMKIVTDAGIQILSHIRTRDLKKRGSMMPLPVIVMTADKSDEIPSKIFTGHPASDHIPKPFGPGQELEEKITRALEGRALVPAGTLARPQINISLHPTDAVVRIETFTYEGAHARLLRPLYDQFVLDLAEGLTDDEYDGIKGGELAKRLKVAEATLRRQIERFRREVGDDFRTKLGRTLDDNDIIQNMRTWKGYRLNPAVVHKRRWVSVRK